MIMVSTIFFENHTILHHRLFEYGSCRLRLFPFSDERNRNTQLLFPKTSKQPKRIQSENNPPWASHSRKNIRLVSSRKQPRDKKEHSEDFGWQDCLWQRRSTWTRFKKSYDSPRIGDRLACRLLSTLNWTMIVLLKRTFFDLWEFGTNWSHRLLAIDSNLFFCCRNWKFEPFRKAQVRSRTHPCQVPRSGSSDMRKGRSIRHSRHWQEEIFGAGRSHRGAISLRHSKAHQAGARKGPVFVLLQFHSTQCRPHVDGIRGTKRRRWISLYSVQWRINLWSFGGISGRRRVSERRPIGLARCCTTICSRDTVRGGKFYNVTQLLALLDIIKSE